MPVEEEVPGWSFLAWEDVKSTADLLALRTLQLQRRDEDHEEISLRLRRTREQGKEHFDATHVLHTTPFEPGELVLLHNTMREADMSRDQKMLFRWLGPYRVKKAIALKGTYVLEELNGVDLGGTVAGNRLKRFYVRPEVQPDFAVPASVYGKRPNRTSLGVRSWHPKRNRSEASDDTIEETSDGAEESPGDETGGPLPREGVQTRRSTGTVIPARV
jgi:hypothetical protein